jgi:hypothetical protein
MDRIWRIGGIEMISKAPLFAVAFLCFGTPPAFAFDEFPDLAFSELAQLSNTSVEAIERATTIFRKQKVIWNNYKVAVAENEHSFLVEFWQPEREVALPSLGMIRNGQWTAKEDIPGGIVIERIGSFRVTLDKKTWRATWNSLEGDKF